MKTTIKIGKVRKQLHSMTMVLCGAVAGVMLLCSAGAWWFITDGALGSALLGTFISLVILALGTTLFYLGIMTILRPLWVMLTHFQEQETRHLQELVRMLKMVDTTGGHRIDCEKTLDAFLDRFMEYEHWEKGAVYLFDRELQQLALYNAQGFSSDWQQKNKIWSLDQTAGGAVRSRLPIVKTGNKPVQPGDAHFHEFEGANVVNCVIVPLDSTSRLHGVLVGASSRVHHLDDHTLNMLSICGHHLGLILENEQLVTHARAGSSTQDDSLVMISELTHQHQVTPLFETIQRHLHELFPYDELCIGIKDTQLDVFFDPLAGVGTTVEAAAGQIGVFGTSILHWFQEHRKPILIEDIAQLSREQKYQYPDLSEKTEGGLLAVPLISQQQFLGGIILFISQPEIYVSSHLRLLEMLAQYTATLYHNMILQTSSQTYKKQFEAFNCLISELETGLHQQHLPEIITRLVRELLGQDKCMIALFQPATKTFRVVACNPPPPSREEMETWSWHIEALDWTLGKANNPPYYIPHHHKHDNPLSKILKTIQLQSSLTVALQLEHQMLGTLVVGAHATTGLTHTHFSLLQALAPHIALVIRNATQYNDLQRSNQMLRETRQHLLHTERLRALGELASGVAHSFNNILSAIQGAVESGLSADDVQQVHNTLKIIQHHTQDGQVIVKRIQDFAHTRQDHSLQVFLLAELAEQAIEMTKPHWQLGPHQDAEIQVSAEIPDDLQVFVDGTQMREVLVNLILNAVDALLPTGGMIGLFGKHEGHLAVLEVKDSGKGIDPELLPRVFEPFFTTKGKQGYGMGLAIAHRTVIRNGGSLAVESTLGKGTVFSIKLPQDDPQLTNNSTRLVQQKIPAPANCRVMVIDDESSIRTILVEYISSLGYEVTECQGGQSGLDMLNGHSFDIVFTDLGMPDVPGWEIADFLYQHAPATKVCLLSGWGAELDEEILRRHHIDCVLSKPFALSEVKNALTQLVSADAAVEPDRAEVAADHASEGPAENDP